MLHYALGDRLVRALTLASRPFFENPPFGFTDVQLGRRMPVLVHAREDEASELDALEAEISRFASLERLDARGVQFEEYDMGAFRTVDHVVTTAGIGRSAWFKDPDGNTIAIFQPE
jgi:catechol 2,3-dioxygenase-like lactoylglutathione lyase family enzyme